MKHRNITYLCLCLTLLGCSSGARVTDTTEPIEPADATIARVNDEPIRQSELVSLLLAGYGGEVLDELVLTAIVRQYAARSQVSADKDMIAGELNGVLEDMAPGRNRRDQLALLDYMLQSRCMSRSEFDLLLERNALLRRLVDPNVVITDETLSGEYERRHGRRVEVRVLAVTSLRGIEAAKRRLVCGADFAALVREMSEDQPTLARDGLLGPICDADEDVPQALGKAAMQLQAVGDRSDIIAYRDDNHANWWCIVQLEKVIPADETSFADVREQLALSLQESLLRKRMFELQQQLQEDSAVHILDPALRDQSRP